MFKLMTIDLITQDTLLPLHKLPLLVSVLVSAIPKLLASHSNTKKWKILATDVDQALLVYPKTIL